MSNANSAMALLRGEIDVNQYWRESGVQQVESAGVFLTEQQQNRALRNLARLTVSLRNAGLTAVADELARDWPRRAGDATQFERYLATFT